MHRRLKLISIAYLHPKQNFDLALLYFQFLLFRSFAPLCFYMSIYLLPPHIYPCHLLPSLFSSFGTPVRDIWLFNVSFVYLNLSMFSFSMYLWIPFWEKFLISHLSIHLFLLNYRTAIFSLKFWILMTLCFICRSIWFYFKLWYLFLKSSILLPWFLDLLLFL